MSTPATTVPRPATGAAAPHLLRTALRIDSWSTCAFGVVLLAGGGWLSGPLGLPVTWSLPFGVAMLGGAAALALLAGYPQIPAGPTLAVVAGNALSAVALLLLACTDVLPLTGLGVVFLLVGALTVACYAVVEYAGLRRLRATGEGAAR